MISTCFKHQKRNLHEGLTILTSSQTKWQAFENAMCTFDTPPPFLGLKHFSKELSQKLTYSKEQMKRHPSHFMD